MLELSFNEAKYVFNDIVDSNQYVELERPAMQYESLRQLMEAPFKLVLVYGEPGTGKTMMLARLHAELSPHRSVTFFETPQMDETFFYAQIYNDIFKANEERVSFHTFSKALKEDEERVQTPIVLLDEAQYYSYEMMEQIRFLSDTKKIKFVIAMHITENEHVITQEHFKTRIWDSIECQNATPKELQFYVQKKLLQHNFLDFGDLFNMKIVKHIYSFTKGNFRYSNNMLFHLFEIYQMTLSQNLPTNTEYISTKMVEMAAIKAGLIPTNGMINKSNLLEIEHAWFGYKKEQNKPKIITGAIIATVLATGVVIYFNVAKPTIEKIRSDHSTIEPTTPMTVKPASQEQSQSSYDQKPIPFEEATIEPIDSDEHDPGYSFDNYEEPLPEQPLSEEPVTQPEPVLEDIYPQTPKKPMVEEEPAYKEPPLFKPSMRFLNDPVVSELEQESVATPAPKPQPVQKPKPRQAIAPVRVPQQVKVERKKEQVQPKVSRVQHDIESDKKLTQTIKILQTAYDQNPTANIALKLANYYYARKDFELAYKYAQESNDLDFDNEASWVLLAKSLMQLGQHEEASFALKTYLSNYNSERVKRLLREIERQGAKR
jgi:type II secretory pathway predicted ATPase ExeA